MTEIPEHLLKRAQEARAKARRRQARPRTRARPTAAPPAAAATATPPAEPRIPAAPPRAQPRRQGPAGRRARRGRHGHRTGRGSAAGGGAVATARAPGGRRARWSHPAPAHGGEVGLHPGRQGHAGRQGPHLAPPAGRRVRGLPGVHGVPARLLGLRERPAAAAGQPQPDAEPVQGAVVLPGPPGAAHHVPPDGRRRDHPGHGHLPADPGALHRPQPEQQARGPQVRHQRSSRSS